MFDIVKKHHILLLILTLTGALLHFFNLNWGAPFYFHPDERNIASAVTQLQFPQQMNPHFFAYGSLPIYTIYFTGVLYNFIFQFSQLIPSTTIFSVTFSEAIIIGRAYSALFATLLIPLLYLIGKKLHGDAVGLIAAFLATTSVGFIQFAHFGTFEMWLTFFSVILFWLCLTIRKTPTKDSLLALGFISGILIATKVSHVAILPIVLIVILIGKYSIKKRIRSVFFVALITATIYTITNPYVFLDTPAFLASMNYESGVALGNLPVFYTGEFFNALPIIFHFTAIYPFLLNPLVAIVFIAALVYVIKQTAQTKQLSSVLLLLFFFILFLSQVFLFVKWTRYMIPTLPFIYLICAIALFDFFQRPKHISLSRYFILSSIFAGSCLFSLAYFITAFVHLDTRIAARDSATNLIPAHATIVSEVYDLGITPFNNTFPHIELFNFYELENTDPSASIEALQATLATTDYVILPSQRVLKTRLQNKEKFAKGNSIYTQLLDGRLGFTKIYETPCDIYCKITYLNSPVYRFEGTANVFDRPTVMIFKKL